MEVRTKITDFIGLAQPIGGHHWSGITSAEFSSFCRQHNITDIKRFCAQLMQATKTKPGTRTWLRSGVTEDVILDLFWQKPEYCIDRKEDVGGGIRYEERKK